MLIIILTEEAFAFYTGSRWHSRTYPDVLLKGGNELCLTPGGEDVVELALVCPPLLLPSLIQLTRLTLGLLHVCSRVLFTGTLSYVWRSPDQQFRT